MTITTTDRKVRCRYIRRNNERCPNEAVTDYYEDTMVLCAKHLYRAHELFLEQRKARSA